MEILYKSNPTGLTGSKNDRFSEYWNTNELIYSIVLNIENPVLSLIAIYLRASSDLTEKWFGKTNTTFLKKYIVHSDFIGDLINSNVIRSLNSNSYRKLIHSFWIGVNTDSAKFHSMNYESKPKKGKIWDITYKNETTIFQHFRRVSGAYKYVLSFYDNVMEEID